MMVRTLLSLCLLSLLSFPAFAQEEKAAKDDKPAAADKPKVDKATADKYEQFAELLSGSRLVGKFTIVGRDLEPPKEEYEILKIKKLPEADYWQFDARIKYGKTNLLVPLKLEVKWAGDTPMITLTDFKIPGLGTFSSRVFFYNNKYAGTWTHGKVHGHMFGVIEKMQAAQSEDASESSAERTAKKRFMTYAVSLIEKHDKDGDGLLNNTELDAVTVLKRYGKMDSDGDGQVNSEELVAAMMRR